MYGNGIEKLLPHNQASLSMPFYFLIGHPMDVGMLLKSLNVRCILYTSTTRTLRDVSLLPSSILNISSQSTPFYIGVT